jgi:hypothetical protein
MRLFGQNYRNHANKALLRWLSGIPTIPRNAPFLLQNGESKNLAPEKTGFAEISQKERGK